MPQRKKTFLCSTALEWKRVRIFLESHFNQLSTPGTKGQITFEMNFGLLKFSQKMNERIHFYYYDDEFIPSFFGRFKNTKEFFQNYLIFSAAKHSGNIFLLGIKVVRSCPNELKFCEVSQNKPSKRFLSWQTKKFYS